MNKLRIMPAAPQFCLASSQGLSLAGFNRTKLGNGVYLYAEPGLAVSKEGDATVIGDKLPSGGGRYAKITADGILSTDTAGLRGIYYFQNETDGLVAVSCPTVAELLQDFDAEPRVLASYSLNWHPTPGTALRGLSTLLPFQEINLIKGAKAPSDVRPSIRGLTDSDRVTSLLDSLSTTISEVSEIGNPHLALTAGLDSRTLLAACLHAGVKPACFTIAFDAESAAEAGKAADIAEQFGLTHQTLVADRQQATPLPTMLKRHWNNRDFSHIASGSYGALGPDDVLLRGSCFEIGCQYYSPMFDGLSWQATQAQPSLIADRTSLGPFGKRCFTDKITEWIRVRSAEPIQFAWVDTFFMDQRVAGWLSGAERMLEAIAPSSVHPANSLETLEALADDGTSGAEIQQATIRRVDSDLAAIDYGVAVGRKASVSRSVDLAMAIATSEMAIATKTVLPRIPMLRG